MTIRMAVAWAILGSFFLGFASGVIWALYGLWSWLMADPLPLLSAVVVAALVLGGIFGLARLLLWAIGELV